MKKITTEQLKKLHVLLHQLGLMDEKVEFIYKISNGRETSSKDITTDEARRLIEHLSKYDVGDKMRKKVFSLAYTAGIIYGDSPADKKMNAAKLDVFLQERGTVKKRLNELNKAELIKVINQFEQINKHMDERKANKITTTMLNELGIATIKKRSSSK